MSSRTRSQRISNNRPKIVEPDDLLEDYPVTFKHNTRSRTALALSPHYMTIEDTDEENVSLSSSNNEAEIIPKTRSRTRSNSSVIDSLEIAKTVNVGFIEEEHILSESSNKFMYTIEEDENKETDTSTDYKESSSGEEDDYIVKTISKKPTSSKKKKTPSSCDKNIISIKTRSKSINNSIKTLNVAEPHNTRSSLKLIIKRGALNTPKNQPEAIPETNISTSTVKQDPIKKRKTRKLNKIDSFNETIKDTNLVNNNKRSRTETIEDIASLLRKKRNFTKSSFSRSSTNGSNKSKRPLQAKIPIDFTEKSSITEDSSEDAQSVETKEQERLSEGVIGPVEQMDQVEPKEGIEQELPTDELLRLITEDGVINKLRLLKDDLTVCEHVLGEGQDGIVYMGTYHALPVACKTRRESVEKDAFYSKILRELTFANKLSNCKYINKYIGWILCNKNDVESKTYKKDDEELYVLQQYVSNGDARSYLYQRNSSFRDIEVLIASICLFSALSDAHKMDVGIVDLKLENYLIDSCGTGLLTDFGSCIDFLGRESVNLEDEEVSWTTAVAAPEMINKRKFSKASDVFMGTLIIAELMTGELTDAEFRKKILRRKNNGSVDFTPVGIKKEFKVFFGILSKGLQNDPRNRPTAKELLESLIEIQDANLT